MYKNKEKSDQLSTVMSSFLHIALSLLSCLQWVDY